MGGVRSVPNQHHCTVRRLPDSKTGKRDKAIVFGTESAIYIRKYPRYTAGKRRKKAHGIGEQYQPEGMGERPTAGNRNARLKGKQKADHCPGKDEKEGMNLCGFLPLHQCKKDRRKNHQIPFHIQ